MLRHRWLPLIVLTLPVLATSCGGGGDEPVTPDDVKPKTLTISLAASSGTSGDVIKISGIPADAEGVYAEVKPTAAAASAPASAPGETPAQGTADAIGRAYILRPPGGDDEIVVPLFPGDPMGGGNVQLRVTNGSSITSNTVTLAIDPPPPAPGAFKDLVDSVQLLLDKWLEQLGTTREELRSTPVDQLPLLNTTLLFVHNVVDNPDNPNSLRALADGDIPLFVEAPIDRDLLDALTAMSGLQGWVDDKIESVDQLTAPVIPGPTPTIAQSRIIVGGQVDCIDPPTFNIGSDNCGLLSEIMQYQTQLEITRASEASRFLKDLRNAILAGASLTPAAEIAAGLASTGWAIDSVDDGQRGMYPSQFINDLTDYKVSVEEFPEDFVEPGKWSEFRVSAVSDGWRFDDKIIEAFQQMAGVNDGLDIKKLDEVVTVESKMKEFIKNGANETLKNAIVKNSPVKLEYCPQTWVGINCTGLPYSVGSSNSLKYDSDQLTYEPVEVGSANLLVETMPVFGTNKSTGETKVIKTNLLEVFIDPYQATRNVNEDQAFTARVANAHDETVAWSSPGDLLANGNSASLHTPSAPWDPPVPVTAKSVSNTGLREGKVDTDPRTKTVYVTYGGSVTLTIDPPYKCIHPGETLQFTPKVEGVDNPVIDWSVVEGYGTIDQNGLYHSMSIGTSSAKISATIEGVPDVIAYANVDVKACECSFVINIAGAAYYYREGADVAYQYSDFGDGFRVYTFFFQIEDGYTGFAISLSSSETQTAPAPGEIGTYEVNMSYIDASGHSSWSTVENPGSMTITSNTDTYMEASFNGIGKGGSDPENPTEVTIIGSMKAGHWIDEWPCH